MMSFKLRANLMNMMLQSTTYGYMSKFSHYSYVRGDTIEF